MKFKSIFRNFSSGGVCNFKWQKPRWKLLIYKYDTLVEMLTDIFCLPDHNFAFIQLWLIENARVLKLRFWVVNFRRNFLLIRLQFSFLLPICLDCMTRSIFFSKEKISILGEWRKRIIPVVWIKWNFDVDREG